MNNKNNMVNELVIALDLLNRLDGDELSGFKILKRDTVDKSDYIYCMIKYIVEDEELTEYYVLTYYRLSTGYWLLKGNFPFNTELWSIKPEGIALLEEAH